jgi:ankyrin repeat protein
VSQEQDIFDAVKSGDAGRVRSLLGSDAGAVNVRGEGGRTPLHVAVAGRGNRELIEALLDAGADVNAKDGRGYTPLHVTTVEGVAGIIHLLLDRGAEINARDNDGKTALTLAFDEGAVDVSDILEQRGGME